jgi:hypothetical protein
MNIMQEMEKDDLIHYDYFNSASIIFQRDSALLRSMLHDSENSIPKKYSFYLGEPKMRIELEDTTTVGLNSNRFSAIIGKDTINVLFDTGGDGVSINQKWVEKYQMKHDTSIASVGILPFINNARFTKHPVIIPHVKIGSMTMYNVNAEFDSFEEDELLKLKEAGVPQYDMVIGLNTFVGFIDEIEFDWKQGKLSFRKEATLKDGVPFLFFDNKAFSSFSVNGKPLVTVFDTGSPGDKIGEKYYLNEYIKKESKSYKQYDYMEYTLVVENPFDEKQIIKVGDYAGDLNLKLRNEPVDLLFGTNHKNLKFNIQDNILRLE